MPLGINPASTVSLLRLPRATQYWHVDKHYVFDGRDFVEMNLRHTPPAFIGNGAKSGIIYAKGLLHQ